MHRAASRAALTRVASRPGSSTKKLEQDIANEDRQLKRLTDRLAKLDDTHLDAVLAKAEEMGRQLAAKRERLKELQRAGRRPKVKSVEEKDVVAALTQLRDLLQGDVGIATQVLRALVGDVVLEKRQVEGKALAEVPLADLFLARRHDLHMLIAGIEVSSTASIASHRFLGSSFRGRIPEAGFKFGR